MLKLLHKIINPKPKFTSFGIFNGEDGRKRLENMLHESLHDEYWNKPWNKKKEKLDSERQWSYSETYSRQRNYRLYFMTYTVCFNYGEFYGFDTTHGFEGYTFTLFDDYNYVLGWAANNNRNGTLIKDFYYAIRRKYHQHGLSLTESDEGTLSFAEEGKISPL